MQIAMKKEKFAKFHPGVLFWTTYEMSMVYIKLLSWHTLLLREKCPYSELFWSVLFRIRTRITPNMDTFCAMSIWEYSNRLWLETLKMLQLFKNGLVQRRSSSTRNWIVWSDRLKKSFISKEEILSECDEDSDDNIYEGDESNVDDGSDYDDFWFEKHLEDYFFTMWRHNFCSSSPDFTSRFSDALRIFKLGKT